MKFKGIQLGIAMQITNILRDIDEDLNRNRIYFPNEYLTYKNSKPKEILKNKSLQKQFSKDLKKLKVFSDLIYSNSRIGIYKLPLKYRVAIGLASRLYQGIGIKIENNNYNIWGRRYYLSLIEKFPGQKIKDQLSNPVWHIHNGKPPNEKIVMSFSMLLNAQSLL